MVIVLPSYLKMSEPSSSDGPLRPGGKIVGTTVFKSKHNEEKEERWCKSYSEGILAKPKWGKDTYVIEWQAGQHHDPLNEHSVAIRTLIRQAGEVGISKDKIITIIGNERVGSFKKTEDMLRELDKMGLFM
jgi:hypothetical protein